MAIQAVVFDCFGVICVGARGYAISQCPELLRPRLDELFDQADYGYISADEFIAQAAELMSITSSEFQSMLDARYARDETMVDMVRSLRQHYKTALLSNANNAIIRRLFTSQELAELFSDVIISSEVGMVKPHPELFELTATRLDCLAEECVMIDDVALNIDGAIQVGMKGVVFTDNKQCVRELQEMGVNA